jgi:hypothetical protein
VGRSTGDVKLQPHGWLLEAIPTVVS